LALPAILIAGALMLWEQAALAADLRGLAATVAAAVSEADAKRLPDAKLEVADGAWGELCHALNRLLQQRRAEQRLRHMLPALPVAGAARLADMSLPQDGLPCDVAVLALAGRGDSVAHLRDTAYTALYQAQLYDALLARWGEGVVLIFGVLGQQDGPAALRGAHHAAQAFASAWSASPPGQRPRLILASGQGRVVVLPGLGLTVVGAPIEQALALQSLAGDEVLVCNEDAYLGLRRLGFAPARPAARLPAGAAHPPAFVVPLQGK
ncbi:MAG: hypothetical protein HGA45_15590, partial [Chloroflexales bacterium]|nr:hypothetical protein [Chloroflexales bacterium]